MRQPFDVEAAGRDVGRDEQIDRAFAEAAHHTVALPLLHAAVERFRTMAVRVEQFDQRIDLEPCAAEHQRRVRVLRFEHAFESRRLVRSGRHVGDLTDSRQLAGNRLLAGDRDARRILQMTLRDRHDAGRQRRREERSLPRRRRGLEDCVQILGETHVEHLVCFVQDQDFHAVQLQRAAPDVIEGTAGSRNDDVRATLEPTDLLRHRRTTIERQHARPAPARVLVHGLRDLHRQLARGHEHEPGRPPAILGAEALDTVKHWQRKRRRLPRSGCGLPEQVAPFEQQWNGLALDGGGLLVAERNHRRQDRVV